MPKISKEKIQKIEEQILFYLFTIFPKPCFTVDIAKEIARDEEFVKSLLLTMLKKNLIVKIDMNPQGIKYERRLRWRISNKMYEIYKNAQ